MVHRLVPHTEFDIGRETVAVVNVQVAATNAAGRDLDHRRRKIRC